MTHNRLFLVGCTVFTRELNAAIAASERQVDAVWLPKDLHDRGGKDMMRVLQERCDQADPAQHDAIALGYGLCNNGLIGLRARALPIIVYRSHDCIGCLLGSRKRYEDEFRAQPGTYWYSAGWIERGKNSSPLSAPEVPSADDPQWLKMVAKYGEDNARFLWDEMRAQTAHYTRLAYVDTGIGPQDRFAAEAERRATERGMTFQRMTGDPAWIRALIDGPWDDERFLTIKPGEQIVARYDGTLVGAEAS
ncbi:MAG: DUF1638 domain-containing protein [Planctomycetota bacterium]